MAFLKALDILGAQDLASEVVEVAEWGGPIRLVELGGDDLLAYDEAKEASETDAKATGRKIRSVESASLYLSFAIRGDESERVFSDEQVRDLAKKNPRIIMRLFKIAARLGLAASREEVAKEAGKSEGAPSDGTSTV